MQADEFFEQNLRVAARVLLDPGAPKFRTSRSVQASQDNIVDTVFLQMSLFESDPAKKRANILAAVRNLAPGG